MTYSLEQVSLFTWTDAAVANGIAPDDDKPVNLTQCEDYEIQIDTTATGHTAASVDLGALFSLEESIGTEYIDTVVTNLGITAFGDGLRQTFHVANGRAGWMYPRLDVNDNVGNVTVRIRKRQHRGV